MNWAPVIAFITGTVDQELWLRNDYPVAENRVLNRQLKGRLLLSDAERAMLGEIGHRLGRKALAAAANMAKPATILGWYRRLLCSNFRNRDLPQWLRLGSTDGARQNSPNKSNGSLPRCRGDPN